MEPFRSLRSRAVPLEIDDVDTDVITPMKRILEGGDALVAYAFEPLRFDARGEPRPDFPLNDPAYADAKILVTGANFGCGSSRETAVWALKGLGFRCLIGPGFGDIFASNCFKSGLLPVVLPEAAVAEIAGAARRLEEIGVSLDDQSVSLDGGVRFGFELAPIRKEALRAGLDDLALVLRRLDRIEAYEARDRRERAWAYL